MTFDDELILVGTTEGENPMGDPITIDTQSVVFCNVQSTTRSEHYSAAANGLKPEIVFVVNVYEYNKEKVVIYDDDQYNVLRTYQPKKSKDLSDFETIELVCEGLNS
ncbi:phage head closure protein [Jeotgalibacillus proteolyticus]|uniref:Phage head-tail adapter protein n=1 Tax=Jeotgalibacillus proteolyticus TaxID=2082395 RepID=A0A2S5GFV4_9BACL|nr:phage head closure protein [Jeotgalibacillus proteolyticus]PPA71910.1 phage head-tail adapter protein [Jeotgalibacillus proteolyticus]